MIINLAFGVLLAGLAALLGALATRGLSLLILPVVSKDKFLSLLCLVLMSFLMTFLSVLMGHGLFVLFGRTLTGGEVLFQGVIFLVGDFVGDQSQKRRAGAESEKTIPLPVDLLNAAGLSLGLTMGWICFVA